MQKSINTTFTGFIVVLVSQSAADKYNIQNNSNTISLVLNHVTQVM